MVLKNVINFNTRNFGVPRSFEEFG